MEARLFKRDGRWWQGHTVQCEDQESGLIRPVAYGETLADAFDSMVCDLECADIAGQVNFAVSRAERIPRPGGSKGEAWQFWVYMNETEYATDETEWLARLQANESMVVDVQPEEDSVHDEEIIVTWSPKRGGGGLCVGRVGMPPESE